VAYHDPVSEPRGGRIAAGAIIATTTVVYHSDRPRVVAPPVAPRKWAVGMPSAFLALYLTLMGLCAVHGVHRLVLLGLYLARRERGSSAPPLPSVLPSSVPMVTVQLPVYDERDVVARLVDAVAALDWPPDRLQIQLLDDSTDDTALRAADALARARARGIDAVCLHRSTRTGFKAGALAAGLRSARGELVAVFDADFVPAPDFLRRVVPPFADPGVGMVQARWDHLNADVSALTVAQATLLDGHFVIEHTARARSGRWFNFNGTAGIWRRTCIDAAGGWQHDTLTEDLDLSYRAQLAGWRFVYLLEHAVPAELPESLAAFRTQQRRWAKGSVEVARKLTGRIVHAGVPVATRVEALLHLWANLAWPVALALALVFPPLVLLRGDVSGNAWVYLPLFLLSTGSNLLFYAVAAPRRLAALPAATFLGIGMAVNQSFAVFEALAGHRTGFVRTPKSGGGPGSYKISATAPVPFELFLAALHLGTAAWAVQAGDWGSVPFLLLFGGGFAWTGLAGLREALAPVRPLDAAVSLAQSAVESPVTGK
jgi:cellulose synthase/poly-beta-1,6-N-acetylglucosamine synthase-like glycosyltransferase